MIQAARALGRRAIVFRGWADLALIDEEPDCLAMHLGIGTAHASAAPTIVSLTRAPQDALRPDVAARARSVATAVRRDGAQLAAKRLLSVVEQ